jgi:sulfur relay (sulfurtransferase) DsrF/TusC family protein
MKRTLQIVTSAYRCNVEEQDDPVLWLAEVMRGAGADLDVLLEGNAVNYAVRGQDASGLTFGGRSQTQPPDMEAALKRLASQGAIVHVVEEDVAERGLERGELIDGVRGVSRAALGRLFRAYDQVWRW